MNNTQEPKSNFISENKGRGLFYAVIAIATFIVMAVGATFAYFTATTASMNSSVQTGSTTLELKYISYGSAWSKDDLIPADTSVVEYSFEFQNDTSPSAEDTENFDDEGNYIKNAKNSMCKDDYGQSICSVYVFQVTNSAPSPQTVSLNIVSQLNGFESLHAMAYELTVDADKKTDYDSTENGNGTNDPIFKKNEQDTTENSISVTDGYNTVLTDSQYSPIYVNRNGVTKKLLTYIESTNPETQTVTTAYAIDRLLVPVAEGEDKTTDERTSKIADNLTIEGGETRTFAMVLYIKNENYDQTATDADKVFEGQVVVSSGDGSTGVSGIISAIKTSDNTVQSEQTTNP